MAFENPRQIVKHQTQNKVLEFNDRMFIAPVELAGNIHAGFSKIQIVTVDTTSGKGEKAVVTTVNVDPIKIKRLHEKMMSISSPSVRLEEELPSTGLPKENRLGIGDYRNLTPSEALSQYGEEAVERLRGLAAIFEKNADKYPINKVKIEEISKAIKAFKEGKVPDTSATESSFSVTNLLFERKINPNEKRRNDAGKYPVTSLQIEHNPRMDNPWTIIMENGWGDKDMRPNGGIFIKKGSYEKEKQTKAVVADDTFREMMRQVSDYIFMKELIFMSSLQKPLAAYEEEKRKEWEDK